MAVRKEKIVSMFRNRNGTLFMPTKKEDNIRRLKEIGHLSDDWNGYGAGAFSSALIDKCNTIINGLDIQPDVYPTGRQSIQMQYELEDRSYLEFEIFEDKTLCLKVHRRIYSNATTMQITENESERVRGIVEDFFGHGTGERDSLQTDQALTARYFG
ncbi:MAG: hypothetical protein LIO99_02875 [Clostridiales bacterium]|nr:hypothetical protein [Clostridiales bacterium]